MARLIDADALPVSKEYIVDEAGFGASFYMVHKSDIDKAPTVDAVEVVRCKDCQHAKPYERNDGQMGYYCQHQNCTFLYGTNWERLFEPIREANDFCSYGERKVSE